MQITLGTEDVEVLLDALKAWKNQPMDRAVEKSMVDMIMTPHSNDDQEDKRNIARKQFDSTLKLGRVNSKARERQCIILQAKLLQAQTDCDSKAADKWLNSINEEKTNEKS